MKERNSQKQSDSMRSRVRTSILLLLLALVAVTATTVAWFSIADRARVRTMSLDIISGVDLRMDLDAHDTIEAYKKTLSFEEIASRIQKEKGFSMKEVPLEPVTTIDQRSFTFENGAAGVSKKRCISGVYASLYGSEGYDSTFDECRQFEKHQRRN